ncbi:unnamed protein product [Rangifer tarandus platyrhynchus]|uniref:Uncharacterized protein n=1 Tax=Rangifer tarandus platyrhynchus TaxID=3082113 RepID=A0ABN8Z6U5_RANTA|nr:unnamed protein product [Rangifer tarandus platyrhynchus]
MSVSTFTGRRVSVNLQPEVEASPRWSDWEGGLGEAEADVEGCPKAEGTPASLLPPACCWSAVDPPRSHCSPQSQQAIRGQKAPLSLSAAEDSL